MNIFTLLFIINRRALSQAELARLAGVSRQAVSLWLRKFAAGEQILNVRADVVHRLALGLGIPMERLFKPPYELGEAEKKDLAATFLWDRFFPSLDEFFAALLRSDFRALSRLVQVVGLFEAANVLGDSVWHKFHAYKKYINPQRRRECEQLWTLQKSLDLI